MYNPTRRNRNIGTAKQGFKKNNKMTIPYYCENLMNHTTVTRIINDHEFIFIIEKTKPNYEHACQIDDIEKIIAYIPKRDYGDLKYFILRQPKKKQEILSPIWGRWEPLYKYKDESYPAIILEAQDYTKTKKWGKHLSVEERRELKRLIADGHKVVEGNRGYIISYDINSVRNTQLYRTIPHEFGHYVNFLEFKESYSVEQWRNFPKTEKEKFAHSYAENLMKNFPRI